MVLRGITPPPPMDTLWAKARSLTTSMKAGVTDLSWPPQPDEYIERGLVKQAGELTDSFLAVRAFVLGLTQPRSPSREAKVQRFSMANALSSVLAGLWLTGA